MPVTKWNFQITKCEEIPEAIAKAFYIACSGRPGTVVIDITKDAMINSFDFSNVNFNEFDMYNIGSDKVNSVDCHSYFVSYEGAGKIVNHIDNTRITQAFDWEMVTNLYNEVKLRYKNDEIVTQ